MFKFLFLYYHFFYTNDYKLEDNLHLRMGMRLDGLRIINELTAAAIAYGLDSQPSIDGISNLQVRIPLVLKMAAVLRGVKDAYAASLYQVNLPSTVLFSIL